MATTSMLVRHVRPSMALIKPQLAAGAFGSQSLKALLSSESAPQAQGSFVPETKRKDSPFDVRQYN